MMAQPHILMVTFPSQGHINPALQLAKRFLDLGLQVTFSTSIAADRRMSKTETLSNAMSFAAFSDGYDDGFKPGDNRDHYMSEMKRRGSETIGEIIGASAKSGRPFTWVIYSNLVPWVPKVAREFHLPSTLFWCQPTIVFDIYYYYLNGYGDVINNMVHTEEGGDPNSSFSVRLPGLPALTTRDLPAFLSASNMYAFAIPLMKEQFDSLDEENKPKVLINTFNALEYDALKSIERYEMVGVGPLIPSAFLQDKNSNDTRFGGDLFQASNNYIEWLNSKPESSVIYLSFGSINSLSYPQMEEMAKALLDVGRPFLWVIRVNANGEEEEKEKLSCKVELEQQGIIVPWCSQLDVLSHPSISCFLTHCGWNSTLETLACGVPVVAFPQWADQPTNTKMVEDVCKIGLRLTPNIGGIVEAETIRRGLELVLGEDNPGIELRKNARKWKDLAREAFQEGGSSDSSLKAFVNEIRARSAES